MSGDMAVTLVPLRGPNPALQAIITSRNMN